MQKKETELKDTKKIQTAQKNNNLYCWVTVNPDWKKLLKKINKKRPSRAETIQLFRDFCESKFQRLMFSKYIFVLEQRRTEDGIGDLGLHCHCLAERNLSYPPSKLKKNLKNSFKNLCNVKNPEIFNIQMIGKEFAQDKMDYILGEKTGYKNNGKLKSLSQELDKKMRFNYLDDIQYYGNFTKF